MASERARATTTTTESRDALEVALSELQSLPKSTRDDRARATKQVYEKRGDLYFLSDKKRATANVKAAIEALDETRG